MRKHSAVRLGIAAALTMLGTLGAIGSGCGGNSGGTSNGDAGKGAETGSAQESGGQVPPSDSGGGGEDTGTDSTLGTEDAGQDGGSVTTEDGDTDGGTDGNVGSNDSGSDGNTPDASDGGDAACKAPALFPPPIGGGIYCPYSYTNVLPTQVCTVGTQECCLSQGGDAGPSVCQAFDGTSTPFNGGLGGCGSQYSAVWQCHAPADCASDGPVLPWDGGTPTTGSTVCCLVGGSLESDTGADVCSGVQKTHFGGTVCAPASACEGSVAIGTFTDQLYVACDQQSDCHGTPDGGARTCTPIYVTGTAIGVCLPQE